MKENLVALLYLLLRDKLPSSDVVECINRSKKIGDEEYVYTSKHLEAHARELAERLF